MAAVASPAPKPTTPTIGERIAATAQIWVAGAAVILVVLMIVPVAPWVLDGLLSLNIAMALVIIGTALYSENALSFSCLALNALMGAENARPVSTACSSRAISLLKLLRTSGRFSVIVAMPSPVEQMIESVAINEACGGLLGWFGRSLKHSAGPMRGAAAGVNVCGKNAVP